MTKTMETSTIGDFSPWFYCVAVVAFHVTKGHVMESVHPKEFVKLGEHELKDIAHFSLPDTTIDAEGDVVYTFRFYSSSGSYNFGTVFFRQTKDNSQARGYVQRSVVVLSRTAECLQVANDFVRVIAPLFFSFGSNVIEIACNECQSWPAPASGDQELIVAGTVIHSRNPSSINLFQDVPLFSCFGSLSVALWALWELVLTGQQILILGPSPDRCSRAVLGVCSLIAPIPVAIDFRPFFTIFDSDFASISHPDNKTPIIIGGTNPFLLRSLEHFPNVVSLGSHKGQEKDETVYGRRNQTLRVLLRNRRWERSLVWTKDEPSVARDEKLIASLRKLGTDPRGTINENNELLRRSFRDLTRRFLLPLENFLKLQHINQRATQGLRVSAYNDDVLRHAQIFDKENFMQYLQSRASGKDKQFPTSLYGRFIDSPNFRPWLDAGYKQYSTDRQEILRTLIVQTDIRALIATLSAPGSSSEVARKVRNALETELAKSQRDDELCEHIRRHLEVLDDATIAVHHQNASHQ